MRSASNSFKAIIESAQRVSWKNKVNNAKNQSKELSTLRLLKDFCLPLGELVAQGLFGSAFASAGALSRLHATALSADVCAYSGIAGGI